MLAALEELRINGLDHVDGAVDAIVELLKGFLVVFHRHDVGAGEAGDGVLGCVADALHLEAQREHVWVETGLGELGEGDVVFFGVFFGLFEHESQGVQALEVGGDGVGEIEEVILTAS